MGLNLITVTFSLRATIEQMARSIKSRWCIVLDVDCV